MDLSELKVSKEKLLTDYIVDLERRVKILEDITFKIDLIQTHKGVRI